MINEAEAEFLQSWLVANSDVTDQPIIRDLLGRVSEMLSDGEFSPEERTELLELLQGLTGGHFEIGELLKSSDLPICTPKPILQFQGVRYCFTGTFAFGERKRCEAAIHERGGYAGSLTRQTHVLVIGAYATSSWKHSSMGNKILKAVEMREQGFPIAIIDEGHWRGFL
jgi:NAD-dependent DNA ligase